MGSPNNLAPRILASTRLRAWYPARWFQDARPQRSEARNTSFRAFASGHSTSQGRQFSRIESEALKVSASTTAPKLPAMNRDGTSSPASMAPTIRGACIPRKADDCRPTWSASRPDTLHFPGERSFVSTSFHLGNRCTHEIIRKAREDARAPPSDCRGTPRSCRAKIISDYGIEPAGRGRRDDGGNLEQAKNCEGLRR